MTTGVECIWPAGAQLGEGALWQAREGAVWFVDIKGYRVYRYQVASGAKRIWDVPEQVGFIVPVAGGGLICGLQSGLHRFEPDSGRVTPVRRVDADRPNNRLNDAHVDHRGRLWFGTMDDAEREPTGSLYRFDRRGLVRCDSDYVITNGPTTSPDNRTLYHVDTLKRVIYAFDLHDDGSLTRRREFVRIDLPGAYPDGPIVDASGCLWIGLYGGWGVLRYSPSGQLIEKIALPVANCTKAAFGGADLRTLYITTAWKGLTEQERVAQPLAGGLFAVEVATEGLPQHEVVDDF